MTTMTDTRLADVLDTRELAHLKLLRAAGCSCPVPLMGRRDDGTRCRLCCVEAAYPKQTSLTPFEGVTVGYTFNQAAMCFYKLYGGVMYDLVDGRLVMATSAAAESLRQAGRAAKADVDLAKLRVERAAPVGKALLTRLRDAGVYVEALKAERVLTTEWYDEYHRMMRFLAQYDHTTVVSAKAAKAARGF